MRFRLFQNEIPNCTLGEGLQRWVLLFKLWSHNSQIKDLSLPPIPMETAHIRAFMRNVPPNKSLEQIPTYRQPSPSHWHRTKKEAHSQSSWPLYCRSPWTQYVFTFTRRILPWLGSSTCLKTEYFKPTGLIWGQFDNIATFRALTHTKWIQ